LSPGCPKSSSPAEVISSRFWREGYVQPTELDAAIRKSLQLYATKMYPRRLAFEGKKSVLALTSGGLQQVGGAARSALGVFLNLQAGLRGLGALLGHVRLSDTGFLVPRSTLIACDTVTSCFERHPAPIATIQAESFPGKTLSIRGPGAMQKAAWRGLSAGSPPMSDNRCKRALLPCLRRRSRPRQLVQVNGFRLQWLLWHLGR
jgi:hypothetical protein